MCIHVLVVHIHFRTCERVCMCGCEGVCLLYTFISVLVSGCGCEGVCLLYTFISVLVSGCGCEGVCLLYTFISVLVSGCGCVCVGVRECACCTYSDPCALVSQAAWMLLAEISEFSTAIDVGFVTDHWKCHDSFVSMEIDSPLVQLLVVIGNLARQLGKIAIQDIKGEGHCVNIYSFMHTCKYWAVRIIKLPWSSKNLE